MKQTIEITARYENLEKLSNFVLKIAKGAGFDETRLYEIETAVDEACTNIIDHAYLGECNEVIYCSCMLLDDSIEIDLHDHGCEFDPDQIPSPNLTTSLENRDEHGLGLYLMYHYMDEIHFTFSKDNGNLLTMIKHKAG